MYIKFRMVYTITEIKWSSKNNGLNAEKGGFAVDTEPRMALLHSRGWGKPQKDVFPCFL